MKRLATLLLTAALVFCGLPRPASAAAVVVHAYSSSTATTCVLAGAPVSPNIVVIGMSLSTGTTVPAPHDSNGVNLALIANGVQTNAHTWIYAYQVPPGTTPTATFTFTSLTNAGIGCAEVSGVAIGTATGTTGGTGSGTTLTTASLTPVVGAGGFEFAVQANQSNTNSSTLTIAASSVTAIGNATQCNSTRCMGYTLNVSALTSAAATVSYGTAQTAALAMAAFWPGPVVVRTNACNSGAATSATSFVCSITTPTTGNVLTAHIAVFTGGSATAGITGFSGGDAIPNTNLASGALVVGGSPPTSVTFTASGAANYIGGVDEWLGVSTTTPVDKHTTNSTPTTATTCVTSSVSPTQAGDGVYAFNLNFTDNAGVGSIASSPVNNFTTLSLDNSSIGIRADSSASVATTGSPITTTWTWGLAQLNNCGALWLNAAASSSTVRRPASWWGP